MKKRQKIRKTLAFLALLLFPLTLNYFSPYISVTGAWMGILSASLLTFAFMLVTAVFFGRSWCAWVCPMAGISEFTNQIHPQNPDKRKLSIVRYGIFGIWFGFILLGFILAGGVRGIDPRLLNETWISVDEPAKYIIYYFVLFLLLLPNLIFGKRGSCHGLCWMSPFLEAGFHIGRLLHLPKLRILSRPESCIDCSKCDRVCPMSIPVSMDLKDGSIRTSDCILCGECVDACPKGVLRVGIGR